MAEQKRNLELQKAEKIFFIFIYNVRVQADPGSNNRLISGGKPDANLLDPGSGYRTEFKALEKSPR